MTFTARRPGARKDVPCGMGFSGLGCGGRVFIAEKVFTNSVHAVCARAFCHVPRVFMLNFHNDQGDEI